MMRINLIASIHRKYQGDSRGISTKISIIISKHICNAKDVTTVYCSEVAHNVHPKMGYKNRNSLIIENGVSKDLVKERDSEEKKEDQSRVYRKI